MITTVRIPASTWIVALAALSLGADAPAPSAEQIEAGRELFAHVWTPGDPRSRSGDGLGPVFNGQSCLACHDQGGPGGAGTNTKNIEVATATATGSTFSFGSNGYSFSYSFGMDLANGRFEYRFGDAAPQANAPRRAPAVDLVAAAAVHPGFRSSRSVVLHRFGTDPAYHAWRQTVPGVHGVVDVKVTQRNPTPLFGVGLIDAIPAEAIEAAAKRKFPGSAKVKGRVSRLADGRVGRFGWKAQTATLDEFVRSAAANEIGLEAPGFPQGADPRLPGLGASGPDLDQADCDALTAYLRSLPAPVSRSEDDDEAALVKAGESTFKAIGCANCHLPQLGDVDGIYSDLLLHDMSPRLADTGGYALFVSGAALAAPAAEEASGATGSEWRTPPLWGLRDSAPYLHDGRAATIGQAISLHAGQGATAAQHYQQLTPKRRQQLEAFLRSLTAPAPAPGVARAR